jgi:glycine cleavage system H protein
MVVILIMLTVIAFVVIDYYFNRGRYRAREAELQRMKPAARAMAPAGGKLSYPPDFLYHIGNMWARRTVGNEFLVGLNDLGQAILGKVDKIEMPGIGTEVGPGGELVTIGKGARLVKLISPVGGRVVGVNEDVAADPSVINRSPYSTGWILRINTESPRENEKALMNAWAFNMVADAIISRLAGISGGKLGPMYADGGELVVGLADAFNDAEWEKVKAEIFKN